MKITIYELLGLVKDGKAPSKIKYNSMIFEYNNNYYRSENGFILEDYCELTISLNDEVEILEDTNEITAEQIMMATDTLNRLKPTIIETTINWNKAVEAIKNNFSTLKDTPKEEKKIPEKLSTISYKNRNTISIWNEHRDKINEIIDCLKSKGDE